MKKLGLLITTCLISLTTWSQQISTFEELLDDRDTFDNNAEGMDFLSGVAIFPNTYFTDGGFWSEFSISSMRDVSTRGYTNQYSVISGEGAKESQNYATAYAFDPVRVKLNQENQKSVISGFFVNNATYAFWSMVEGDAVAKRFGGVNGSDPDYFKLTIHGYLDGEFLVDSVDFFLADYRFSDNDKDYIVDDWKWVDLESLGPVDSIELSLSSSDVGGFGMNTPAYFCLDDMQVNDKMVSNTESNEVLVSFGPNPCTDFINLEWPENITKDIVVYDLMGNVLLSFADVLSNEKLDISMLKSNAHYAFNLTDDKGHETNVKVFKK